MGGRLLLAPPFKGARAQEGAPVSAPPRSYVRIEYRDPNGDTIELTRQAARFLPLAAILDAEGRQGDLVVVDDETGRVLIRHRLVPVGPLPGDAPSPPA
jgi:hypothetical protein